MGLKDKVRSGISTAAASGFQLIKPTAQRFTALEGFQQAVQDQADHATLIDASILQSVDIDGRIVGSGYGSEDDFQLSHAAFSDLCHFCKIPVSFIKRRAVKNEALALEIISDCLAHEFGSGSGRSLVVDTKSGRVDGIVGTETYAPISNAEVLGYGLTASPDLDFASGWLEGPNMRFSTLLKGDATEAQVGDVVAFGSSIWNAVNGDASVLIADYNERKVCTNGMIRRDAQHTERVIHRGDVGFGVQSAVVRSANRAAEVLPLIQAAAATLLEPSQVRAVRSFISDSKQGGSPSLDNKVVEAVVRESKQEGREEGEVTLWNFVNGITEAAHDTSSMNRRAELEGLGFRTLARFGATLVN